MGTENMKICIVSFTKKGYELSCDIAYKLEKSAYEVEVFTKCSRLSDENIKNSIDENYRNSGYISQNISDWTAAQMSEKKALIFIGACGIAVRAVASSVNNKLKDSPVIVIDELGKFVIPILSGHVGGANELAVLLAALMNATPVITTATDINNKFAVDVFAKKCRLAIVNKDGIARVSSKVLAGEVVTMSVDWEHIPAKHRQLIKAFLDEADMSADAIKTVDFPPVYGADIVVSCEKAKGPKNGSIYLKPTQFVLGIGCRRDTAFENIDRAIRQSLLKLQIDISDIDMIASIDVKKDEPGIKEFCERNRIEFVTYTADELMAVQGEFSASQFVREHVGVDNVCERAAVLACSRECNKAGKLIYKKHKYDRVTVAAAKYPD